MEARGRWVSPPCCCYFIFKFYLLHVRVEDAGYTMHVEVRARFVFGSLLPAFGFRDYTSVVGLGQQVLMH